MREIRPSGSEGGGADINRPSLPLSFVKLYHYRKTIYVFISSAFALE
jgi:hypothetical protein